MSNWRPFTIGPDILAYRDQAANGSAASPDGSSEHEQVWAEVLADAGFRTVEAERRQRLKEAGCEVDRLPSARLRRALIRGVGVGDGFWPSAPNRAALLRLVVRDLLLCEVPPNHIGAVLRASACSDLAAGHWGRIAPLVASCQKEMAREAAEATWRDPPTHNGTDDLVLRAAVALTYERGAWGVAPAVRACDELARWVTDQGLPLPPDWPKSGQSIGFALRRVKKRLTCAGVWWKQGRIGGKESNGTRPTFYFFAPWGKGGGQDVRLAQPIGTTRCRPASFPQASYVRAFVK